MILKFIQSLNQFYGFITLVVGGVAVYLYLKQKRDHKRDAARLIVQEIRYAEEQIRSSGRGGRGYALSSKLLPTNSWNDNIHLFTKDLKEIETDMISEFYSKATYIDSLITERSQQKINPKFFANTQPMTQPLTSATAQPDLPIGSSPQQSTPQQTIQMTMTQIPTPGELMTMQILIEVSSSVEFLYNTPAVDKLRKISEHKWYQLT